MAERQILKREEFPANSHRSKEGVKVKVEEKKVEKVVKGKVHRKKQSLGRRLSDTFLEEDGRSVGEYILYDVLIPAAKDTLSELVKGGIEMLLYGESRGASRRESYRDGSRTYVGAPRTAYHRMSDGRDQDRRVRRRNARRKAMHEFDDIVFPSKAEAKEVLVAMRDIIDKFEVVTVEDFYDLIGETASYTDARWGWYDLRDAYLEPARGGGYIISLPATEVIEDD